MDEKFADLFTIDVDYSYGFSAANNPIIDVVISLKFCGEVVAAKTYNQDTYYLWRASSQGKVIDPLMLDFKRQLGYAMRRALGMQA